MGGSRGVGHVWWTPGKYATDPPPPPANKNIPRTPQLPSKKVWIRACPFLVLLCVKKLTRKHTRDALLYDATILKVILHYDFIIVYTPLHCKR